MRNNLRLCRRGVALGIAFGTSLILWTSFAVPAQKLSDFRLSMVTMLENSEGRETQQMTTNPQNFCRQISWQGREAFLLGNGVVQLTHLTGGGHIAEFRFSDSSGAPTLNPLWIPSWKTKDPQDYQPSQDAEKFGPPVEGRMLAGIAGHNLCLDYFGVPSEEEGRQGLSIHGEAPNLRWQKKSMSQADREVSLTLSVDLPVAGLEFSREVKLQGSESVVYFKETVRNKNKADHFFHWQQHVTLGSPFLSPQQCRIAIPGTQGQTHPGGYGGKELLKSSADFRWPYAPGQRGKKTDLRIPLAQPGRGFVATVLIDPRREMGYVVAVNYQQRLLIGYLFRRADFPWVAIWEENKARDAAPWLGREQTRGLEFGSTALPLVRRDTFSLGPLFDTPTHAMVPACGEKTIRYVGFLAQVPPDFGPVRDITMSKNQLVVHGKKNSLVSIEAGGMAEW